MGYCNIDDIKKMLPEAQLIRLTDDESTGSINTIRVQEAIDSAAEEIDAYIGSRVKLPITGDVPPILGKFNTDMAIYNLYSRVTENIPETRSERYRNAVKTLAKVNEGKISLGIQPEPDPPDEGEIHGSSQISARDKMFDSDTMEKF